MLMKALAHLFLANVNGREHDVAGGFFAQLHDAFAKVRVNHFDPILFQKGIEVTFFGEHGFAFHQPFCAVALQNRKDNLVVFCGIHGPVNDGSEFLCGLRTVRGNPP
jgi:hypothetical protein